MRIDQLLPTFSWGDAIGNHTLALRATLRRWGFTSEIFQQKAHHRLAGDSRFFEEYKEVDRPENVLIYHYSIGSVQTAFFAGLSCRKVMIYHNITPSEFFRGVNRRIWWECEHGRRALASLAGRVDLALGDSEYNRQELAALGFSPTGILPISIPFDDYGREPDRGVLRAYRGGPNILHVGRIAPNKKIEDLAKAFYFVKKSEPAARLILVGTDVNLENYSGAVRNLATRLGLTGVVFAGHVRFEELLAFYRAATVYLSMSEHEGFCVPLVESMLMDLPVVAFAAGAVPGTLGDAGILLREKNFPEAAEVLCAIIRHKDLHRSLADAGRRRLAYFGRSNLEGILLEHLSRLGVSLPARS